MLLNTVTKAKRVKHGAVNVSTARNVSDPIKMKSCAMLRLCETLGKEIKIDDAVIRGLLL